MCNIKYKLTNQLMFAIVMRDAELCKELLSRIIPERRVREIHFTDSPVINLDYIETEKSIIPRIFSKSVRLDVYFEDDDCLYDLELQIVNRDSLPKRSRYYHSSMAVNSLEHGNDYRSLKPSYVIFICLFDLMEHDEPIYRFRMLEEKNYLPLNDGQYTIILNGKCSEDKCPAELKTFYAYLNKGIISDDDEFIKKIHSRVERANNDKEVQGFMTVQEQLELDAREIEHERARADAAEAKADAAEAKAEQENKLTILLLQQNRIDDLKKAMVDEAFRKQLITELNL